MEMLGNDNAGCSSSKEIHDRNNEANSIKIVNRPFNLVTLLYITAMSLLCHFIRSELVTVHSNYVDCIATCHTLLEHVVLCLFIGILFFLHCLATCGLM